MPTITGVINTWGNGAALRLTKPITKASGIESGTPVTITAERGRIVIEAVKRPSLEQVLQAFDPERHGGEAMAVKPVGREVIK